MRRFRRALLSVALAVALAPLSACKNNGQRAQTTAAPAGSASNATVAVDTGGHKITFRVELALTPDQQHRGLMYRQSLAPDAGMLFVFDQQAVQSFWMKNTLIPLDMLFIGADRRIVGIVASAEPQTEIARSVGLPSLYVLEIGGGLSGQLGIRPGQVAEFQGVPSP
jgi:uncharacterized membrane protein (UPF0127 family)